MKISVRHRCLHLYYKVQNIAKNTLFLIKVSYIKELKGAGPIFGISIKRAFRKHIGVYPSAAI